jgi:Gpi18-like mannosyltransferase
MTRIWILLFALGLALRLGLLSAWGTFDTEVQKAWAARAATAGLAGIYGPDDREMVRVARAETGSTWGLLTATNLPRTRIDWDNGTFVVDYPPGSLIVLWGAGKLYRALRPEMPNRPLFNAVVNLGPLLGSVAIAALLYRSARGMQGRARSLAFWLNPAVLLAAPVLGGQDPLFAALALAAVLGLAAGRHATAAALVVAAGLVKPQGALLLPTLLFVLAREARPRAWGKAALAGLAVAALVLMPWWASGHLLSALDGCRRTLIQGALSAQGLNLWWLAGWVMEWTQGGPWPLARIQSVEAFRQWAGWDPRLAARALLAAATVANLLLMRRWPAADRRIIALSVILQVHAYAFLATSVHENHTFLAVVLAPLLLGVWPRARALLAATSTMLFLNLFLVAGLGRRVTTLRFVEELRMGAGVDLTVVAAVLHAVLLVALFAWVARPRGAAAGSDAAGPAAPSPNQ